MVARLLCTGAALLLAAGAFFGASPTPAGPLNILGILFLTVAGVIWLAWPVIHAGFVHGKPDGNGADLPMAARFGPVFITGLIASLRGPQPPRRTD
jgi:hypothetical protein